MSDVGLKSLLDVFATPSFVFDRIHNRQLSAWFPFILLLVFTAIVFGWYFFSVDMYSFLESSLIHQGQKVVPEDLEITLQQEDIIRWVSVGGTVLGTIIFYLIIALYFFLAATLVAEEKLMFKQLFALICWASIPGLITLLSMAVSYSLSTEYVYFSALDKTNLASLLGINFTDKSYDFYSTISVASIWCYTLYGYGFYRLVRCSIVSAVVVAVIPAAIHLGLAYFL